MQNLQVEFDAGPDGAALYADEAQIEHLLMNLVLNAAQASPQGGVIRLRIEPKDGQLRFIVEDGGLGMSSEVRDRAFEAFFTTKAKGTGLGLSICRKIVDAHDGSIRLESEEGHGTIVLVDLPRRQTTTKSRRTP